MEDATPNSDNVVNIADAKAARATINQKRSKTEEMVRQFLDLLKAESNPESLFHTPRGELFARIRIDGHLENWPLESRTFREWVAHAYYKTMGGIYPDEKTLRMLGREFTGKAKFEGKEHEVSLRIAEHGGNIYLDLCDDQWRSVEITANGWRVTDKIPILFRRDAAMSDLPKPEPGGKTTTLLNFLNLGTRDDRVLVLTWIVAAFFPGPYTILALHGTHGSAKTTTAWLIRSMIDPSQAPLRSVPKDERDLVICAKSSHVIGFDNLSQISDSFSDALCRMATGSGFGTRRLYTDDEQIIFNARRPIMFNGIEDLASRGDLLDRILLIRLPEIKASDRRQELQLREEFSRERPKILGALLDAVCVALRNRPKIRLTNTPRMADFAFIGCAAERALGFRRGEFIAAYRRNREESHLTALEASPAACEIQKFLSSTPSGNWKGTAGELLSRLNRLTIDDAKKDSLWPKSARGMGAVLDRSKPNLEHVGISVERLAREGGTGRRLFRLTKVTNVTPSQRKD